MDAVHTAERLKELQALPLYRKIQISQTRIIEWYIHFGGNVCVSFSGGKDSTVLLHIARQIYPDIPAVFSNTGLEYPEIQRFVRGVENVDILTPDMRFTDVITTYGYPLIGKEVADAIYYARRIRGQTKRERERDGRAICSDNEAKAVGTLGLQTAWKRTEILGKRPPGNARNWGGGEPPTHRDERIEEQTNSPQRTDASSRGSGEWNDWRRGCL